MNEDELPPPQPFSDSMERRLAVEEARRPKRTRVRTVQCVMPECAHEVHRRNLFPLCMNHLLLVWKVVNDGNAVSPWTKENGMWLTRIDRSHVVTEEEVEARRLAARQRQREIATTPGTLYALDTGAGTIKIGWTGRPLIARLKEYAPHVRLIVSVPGTLADERDVHRSLRMFRAAGNEWYRVEGEVIRQVNTWIALQNMTLAQSLPNANYTPRLLPKFTTLEEWGTDVRQELLA